MGNSPRGAEGRVGRSWADLSVEQAFELEPDTQEESWMVAQSPGRCNNGAGTVVKSSEEGLFLAECTRMAQV